MTTTPAASIPLAHAPMPVEQAEAHIQRIEHLLADLEVAARSLRDASWGPSGEIHTARPLPDGTTAPLVAWTERIRTALAESCEQEDTFGYQ